MTILLQLLPKFSFRTFVTAIRVLLVVRVSFFCFVLSLHSSLAQSFTPAVNDCLNGNANGVCPASQSTCEDTDASFVCACTGVNVRSPFQVCSTRIPGGGGNNHCTKTCIPDPCLPNPCTGGTCSFNGAIVCTCPVGWRLSGTTCVNNCDGVVCGVGSTACLNGICLCRPGYHQSADRKSCVDRCLVDGLVPCSGPLSSCMAGECKCGGDNVLRAGVCESGASSSTACNASVCNGGQCTLDEANQRVCRCPAGMELNSAKTCVFSDLCVDGKNECVAPATCLNQVDGTYVCSCEQHNMMTGANLVLNNRFECGQPCPKNCNGVGTCNDGVCSCPDGFVPDMEHGCRAQCPNDCFGKGNCTASGFCMCDDPAEQTLDCSGESTTVSNVDTASPHFGGLSMAVIGGGVGGGVALILIVVAVIVCACRARKNKAKERQQRAGVVITRYYRNLEKGYGYRPEQIPMPPLSATPADQSGPYGMNQVPLHSGQYIYERAHPDEKLPF